MTLALPLHGTLIEYQGIGIYLIGPSGSGKSETALQLISVGACLVCDDAPIIQVIHNSNDSAEIIGHCPENFAGQMHIRDLGIIHINELFGQEQVKNSQRIDFVIEIVLTADYDSTHTHTKTHYQYWQFQSQQIPGIRLYHGAGRNIALLIYTAVLQFKATAINNNNK